MCPIFEADPKILKNKKEQVLEEQAKTQKKERVEPLQQLQQQVGNQAVQRLLVQRSSEVGFELDEETGKRIQAERSSGQALDRSVQDSMGQSFEQDFSGVHVHTSSESDALNHELGAKAFTTGVDIFFRSGAYDPGSATGQRLIAHELTHVVQQRGSSTQDNAAFRVHPAGDVYEQEADASARHAMDANIAAPAAEVQRQEGEEEDFVQRQEEDEEEEEELVQLQDEEEEEIPEETKAEGVLPEEEEQPTKMIDEEDRLLLSK